MRTFPKTRAAAGYAARHARAELARPGPVKGGEQAGLAVVITRFGAERGLGPCHDVGDERLGWPRRPAAARSRRAGRRWSAARGRWSARPMNNTPGYGSRAGIRS